METITLSKKLFGNLSNLNKLNRGYELDDRYVALKEGKVYRIVKEIDDKYVVSLMKPFKNRDGYLEYVLTNKNKVKKHITGQIAICGTFQNNPKNLPHVNHNDGKRDNIANSNLHWSSISYNIKHSYRVLGRKPSNKK